MGTLTITYGTTTHTLTCTGAPSVSYNYNNKSVRLSSNGWSGTKTIGCKGKVFANNITIGRNVNGSAVTTTLKTSGKLANNNIVLTYTPVGNASVQSFTTGGSKSIPAGGYTKAQFFIVGAGGYGGGYTHTVTNDTEDGTNYYQSIGGGGGGGYTLTTPVIDISNISSYTVTIGNSVVPTEANQRPSGNPSTVTIGGKTYTANGGQSGESAYGSNTWSTEGWAVSTGKAGNGGAGGCGGGSIGYYYAGDGGTNGGNGKLGHLNNGRKNNYVKYMSESVGQEDSTYCDWTGTGIYYAGGGGGAQYYRTYSYTYSLDKGGNGGDAGGGNGYAHYRPTSGGTAARQDRAATAGTNGTGGGGGGKTTFAVDSDGEWIINGCSGGSGVVIAKFWEA